MKIQNTKQPTRIVSMLLALMLLFSFVAVSPTTVFASDAESISSGMVAPDEEQEETPSKAASLPVGKSETTIESQVDSSMPDAEQPDETEGGVNFAEDGKNGQEDEAGASGSDEDPEDNEPEEELLDFDLEIEPMIMAYGGEQLVNSKTLDGIYFRLSTGYSDTAHWRKAIYGLTAYCVEPGVMNLGSEYYEHEVSGETWFRMSLADYWGRHVMSQINGKETENNFYVQLYVWEQLGHQVVELSGPTVSLADYQDWKARIMPCLDAFFVMPSFANSTVTLKTGESTTLTDSKKSLSYYRLLDNPANFDIMHDGDTLKLTATKNSNDGRVRFRYDISNSYHTPMYYWTTNNGQDVASIGVGDPVAFDFSVKVIKQGTMALVKTSEDGAVSGLQFNVKSTSGSYNQNFTTDSQGRITQDLEAGTYVVSEINVPGKYVTPSSKTIEIRPGETTSVSFNNILKKFRVNVTKADADMTSAQGNASLQGAVYGFYNSNNQLLDTYTTNANGQFTTKYYVCGSGYYIQEITPSPGYQLDPTKYVVQGTAPGSFTIELNSVSQGVKEQVIRGGVRVEKWDNELDSKTPQGDASLAGAVIDIYNRSKNPVVVNGTRYAVGAVVHTMTTDANGVATTSASLLPYGDYEAIERTPPTGYQGTGTLSRKFSITTNGVIIQLTSSSTAIKNNVIRGGVSIQKWDNEANQHKPQGGATLQGAVFDIYNRSAGPVLVNGTIFPVGTLIMSITTNKDGVAATANNALPYGSYRVIERTPPEGYLPTGVLTRDFSIRQNGQMVYLNTSSTAIKNNPIRGDLKGVKVSDGDMQRLANVPFKITSATTGENHVVVTDANGQFDTSSSWNLHTTNTNRGETEFDGVWFGDINKIDNSLGALLYDTYIIEELPCEANALYELLPPFTVKVYRNSVTVDLGTLTNDYITPPQIGTTATDSATGGHSAYISKTTTIIDVVEYTDAKVGTEYTLVGTLMDRATGKPILVNGKQVTGTTTFTPDSKDGFVEVEFTFDSLGLVGKTVVVFEKLFVGKTEIAAHEDIKDEGQSITFIPPEIGTMATDADSETRYAYIDEETTIIDVVRYVGLTAGYKHTISGTLMDKATGKPVLVDGKPVTGSTTFTADAPEGTVEVRYTFNSVDLAGRSVVVFETLLVDGKEIAEHADIDDEGQTITFGEPEIGTTATDTDTGSHHAYIGEETIIVDLVEYHELKPGSVYTISGLLMDKATGEPLLVDGEEITGGTTFTPEEPSGTVEVEFVFDSVALAGKSVVVFESLYIGQREIAVHHEIEDEGQTITFEVPEIGTTATDADTGTHDSYIGVETTIIDVVEYRNLKPGQQYTVFGKLMDQETGEPVLVDGEEITGSTTFTPEAPGGTVEVKFVFNSIVLAGKSVVVFETLYIGEREVAVHHEIEDEGQTVTFEEPEIGTSAEDSVTGNHSATVSEKTTIIDTVSYTGLKPGQEYEVEGILMVVSTGEPLLVDGEPVTASKVFTAPTSEGTVQLEFTFSSAALKGETIVVFESLYVEDIEIATHTDINDFEQSVSFETPYIGTTAKDSLTEENYAYALEEITIDDTVRYTGLTAGQEYTLSGILMDKATGKPLLVDGKEVKNSVNFVADAVEGSTDVSFTFDALALRGKAVVVFETLLLGENELATHANIEDKGQTIEFLEPEISTSARDGLSGKNTADPAKHVAIIDTVSFKGLKPGHEYTMRGVLMDKESGKPLLVDGKEIRTELTFTAEKAEGAVELVFIFDASGLAGKEVVVFENLYYKGKEIATHSDLEDKAQTVKYNVPPPPKDTPNPKTGDDTNTILWVFLCIFAVIGLGGALSFALLRKRKNKRQVQIPPIIRFTDFSEEKTDSKKEE